MEMQEISEEQWEAWKLDPVTQALSKFLKVAQQGLMEQWLAGGFQGEGKEDTYILESFARGEGQAYKRIADLEFEQLVESLKDD